MVFRMDSQTLVVCLKKTLEPALREEAEIELGRMRKIIGFLPAILDIVMCDSVETPVRQAGVIYVKNVINQHWATDQSNDAKNASVFYIHEQDKSLIRENIIESMVRAPESVRAQFAICLSTIIKRDYPGKWPQIVDKISIFLQLEPVNWYGALSALYRLVKHYEYKKGSERKELYDAMSLLLPLIYKIFGQILDDRSNPAVDVKKQILKIFFALIQITFPLELITQEIFTNWMQFFQSVIQAQVPAHTLEVDIDERPLLIWWKEKKWAMHIIRRVFERFGSPGNVAKEYSTFAEWYLKTFSGPIIESILKILHLYRSKIYVSPRVIQQCLNYLNTAVSHAQSWCFIKEHILAINRDIIFPLMSYSQEDAELWENDPHEFVREKYDVFEEFISPVAAAQTLLHSVCRKRKGVLNKTMDMLMQALHEPQITPSQKDGAMHMIGTMANILMKKKLYKDRMEEFLVSIVFPEFCSTHGHLRARACWMLCYFSDVKFNDASVFERAIRLLSEALLKNDSAIPIKFEAALSIQSMLAKHCQATVALLEDNIKQIMLELLKMLRETENDELSTVIQKVLITFKDQLSPVIVDICHHIVGTFSQVLESSGDNTDEKTITSLGLLNTLESIVSLMDHDRFDSIEHIVIGAIERILSHSIVELYEEAFSLIYDLSERKISVKMWHQLKLVYDVFNRDGADYFIDMMPALHNYVTVDTSAFLSSQDYVSVIFQMCKNVLETDDMGEDAQTHAAKLLEVIILQCKDHQIDGIVPSFIEIIFVRLGREIKTPDLRIMCLLVLIAALLYKDVLLIDTLQNKVSGNINCRTPATNGGVWDNENRIKQFIDLWIGDTDGFTGLHDRKLCVLGICRLLQLPELPGVSQNASRLIPSMLLLFDGLKRVYEIRAECNSEDNTSDEGESSDDDATYGGEEDVLNSDEDEIDEDSAVYLETLEKKVNQSGIGEHNMQVETSIETDDEDDDDYEDDNDFEETSLEGYTTPIDGDNASIDEYMVFKDIMNFLNNCDSQLLMWRDQLMVSLTQTEFKKIQDVLKFCDQRQAVIHSKSIEMAGGYNFQQLQNVPCQFNFGSNSNSSFTFGAEKLSPK